MADVTISASMVKELREKTGAGMMDAKKALVEANGDMDNAIDVLRERGVAKAAKKGDRVAAEGMTYIATKDNTSAIIELNSETDFVATNDAFNDLLHAVANTMVEAKPADMSAALEVEVAQGKTLNDEITQTSANTGEKITFRRFDVIEKSNDQNFGVYVHTDSSVAALVLLEGGNEDVARDVAMHISAMNPQYVSRQDVPSDVVEAEKNVQMNSDDLAGKPDNIKEKMVEGRLNKFLSEISLLDQSFVKNGDQTIQEFLNQNNAKVLQFIRYQVGEGIEKKVTDLAEEVSKQLGN